MASRIFNIFRRSPSRYVTAKHTLDACQRTFTYGIEEINASQQNVKSIYGTVIELIKINQVKLQVAEELFDKLVDQMSSLGGVAARLRDQIDRDERHLQQRKQQICNIQSEISNLRTNLESLKDEHGFNEWVEQSKEGAKLLEEYKTQRQTLEMDMYVAMKKIQQLSEDHDEIDLEMNGLQEFRDNYIEVHDEDVKALTVQLNELRIKRQLFTVQPLENSRQIISLYACGTDDLEKSRQELLLLRAARQLKEKQIDSQMEEEDIITLRNEELMFKVLMERNEVEKMQADKKSTLSPLERMILAK